MKEVIQSIMNDISKHFYGGPDKLILDIITTHLSNKVLVDKDKIDNLIETRRVLKSQTTNIVSETYIEQFIADLQSLLPNPNKGNKTE